MAAKNPPPPETWAGTVKAIGVKALVTGQFWPFCISFVALLLAYRIESSDWVRIVDLVLSNSAVAAGGWGLAGVITIAAIVFINFQRRVCKKEMDRLVDHRNDLQQQLSVVTFASSEFRANGATTADRLTLEGESA